nr:immunoglobulin heavy chain junction region [Macaca mulatta]MPN71511.1 immunoglobulin heavy chain junction region [Macaca mulatta]MPN71642.1 immunoglobulin heavy chain junction region [Macaca mulatta]MPN73151.1 immunoglobulin heavy chain junction region [Macaca mulatta]MPN73314.1 immunoglobulin heavy chain junction region [Macaca mulatta]
CARGSNYGGLYYGLDSW